MIVSYDDYKNVYGGAVIPLSKWAAYSVRANNEVNLLIESREVPTEQETNQKLAICAVADALYQNEGKDGVTSESTSGVSQSYDTQRINSAKLRACKQYLGSSGLMYRGF